MIVFLLVLLAFLLGGGLVAWRAGYIQIGSGQRVTALPGPPGPQKMICPYDGLELTGDSELDKAVHLQCINMGHFILEMEVERRATELANTKIKELPPPPKWEVKVTNNSTSSRDEYPFRWTVLRDGVKKDTGTARSEGRALREGNARMLDLQRRDT